MATKTVTIDTGEWLYPDTTGVTHTVTNAQTFTFTLTDGGASAVTWINDLDGSLSCTDGSRVTIRRHADNATNGTGNGNTGKKWGLTADAQEGAVQYGIPGEFVASHSSNNIPQYWRLATINADDTDTPTSITAKFEDQFGRSFTWTTVTVS